MKSKKTFPFQKSIVFRLLISVILIFIAMTILSNFAISKRQETLMSEMGEELENVLVDSQENDILLLIVDNAQLKSTTEFQMYSFSIMIATILLGSLAFFLIIMHVIKPLKVLTEKVSLIDIDNVESLRNEIVMSKGGYELEELSKSFDAALNKIYESYEKQKQFSANVAHELRTPLAVLRTKIDVFKKKQGHKDAEIEYFISTMENNVTRLSELVEGILFLSRDAQPQYSQVNVRSLLEEILLDVEDKAKEKEISMTIKGEDVVVLTDDMLLERTLLNLIDNAIKYNVEGGYVEVSLSESESEVVIQVADTGIGISDEKKKHIFDLFYRIEESRSRVTGGYGIGLALVQNIITRLGGSISVSDNIPQGSIFQVVFKK
ncbi:sensor histidine kinase [Sporanaerobacter acetigenes]|uniref:histidine kinase n=1 Tax=Sporanaerobacter acetigenes DSM 13106 TaxID=1123281 RepID=A0A1M5Z766_9FIRM|nr:HAMP domain-containing sensor histidine kinase [Sporanaerobacter acetigenes]SHI19938.1 Signal transduction histidine kinase [Sporanaerobacter acetigenes DSM 13106]